MPQLCVMLAILIPIIVQTESYCFRGNYIGPFSVCTSCPGGWYQDEVNSYSCKGCGPGTYGYMSGRSSCFSCHTGKYKRETTYINTYYSSCKYCPTGYEAPQTKTIKCSQCVAGTYNDQIGLYTTSCKYCQAGYYNQLVGSRQSSACIQCSRGKYSDFIGASSCKPCVKGRFNTNMGSADAQSCLPCPAGKSSNIESLMTPNDCTDCAKGKYQTLEGSVECINCGAGRYGVISGGSVESICKDCSPGMQQPSVFSQQCYECPVGKYSSEMSTTLCTGCEKGLYSNKTRSTSCYECPKGRNLVDTSGEAHYHSSIKNCSFCPIGTYNPIPGLGTACFSCPGSNKVGTRSCNGCDPGKYKKGAQGCFLCDAGKHTDAMDLPNCRDCPTGWYASEARPYVRCLPCKRGFFGDIAGAINVNYGCKMCSRGRYSAAESLAAEVGKIPCTGCPLGRYSTEEGVDKESRCVYCQPGRYSSVLSLSTPTCVRCSEGKFSEKVGCTSNTCCKNCPVGFSQAFNASAFCIGCRAGTFNTEEGKSKCKECPRGKFKPALSDKSSLCNKCPAGYAQNFTSQAQCSACMPGMTAGVAGSQTCVKCEKGRYVGHKASKTPNCKLAPIGKYVSDGSTSTIPVPEGFRASSCVDENGAGCQASFVCVAGKFGALPPTGAPCNECPIGYFSSLGWVNCQKCAPGKFASKKSSTVCTSCPIGYVQLAENQPQCSKCELGKSTSMAGSKYCEILFNGTIAPPDLRSLRPVDRFSSGLILTVDSLIPESVVSILIQWSTSKKFRNTSGEMRELILSKHHVMSRPIVFNASRSGPVWRSPIYLRASWMLSSGRIGRFSEINGYSRVASDCRQQYLQTHPNDDLCSPPLDLLLKEDFHPQCKECPPGGSCNCNYEYPGAPGILVWNIAPLQGYWRVPWEPTNSTPLFYRCPRPDACLGVSLDDTFNATHGWPWPIENENIENSKSCPPNLVPSRCKKGTSGPLCSICEQGYNRVQGSCEKCIPATTRITYLILTLIIFCPLLIYAVRIIRKTRSEIRYALRDANRILLIFVSLSQINVTITEVVNIQWPQNVLKFLDQFSWANIDLVVITGATCEAGVDFRFTFVCMASIPVIIFSLAVAHYFRGTRIILQRIKSLRKGTEQQKRKEKLLCYVEIFCVVDADHSGKISASEFVDLLKLVGYDNKSGKLTTSIALRAIQRITGSTFATSLSMNRFVDGMEKGKIVEVADALLGARTRRRSSGSRLLDSVSEETGELVPRRKGSIFKRRETRNVFHKSDAFSLVLWNHHRKLVTSSFSWAMQFLMLMHTPISRKVFQYLDCAEIGRGDFIRSFVRADYSIPCRHLGGEFDLAYLSFLPLVIIVLCGFTILLPFGILAFLIYQRKHLYSPGVHAKIGWLYERMNRGAEFWEIFEMLRKMVLTGVVVFFPRDPAIKSIMALTVCIGAQISLSLFRPHRSKLVFVTAQFAYGMALCMYLMTTVLAFSAISKDDRESFGLFIVVAQSLFLAFGITAIIVTLVTIKSRFKSSGRKSMTAEAHILAADRRSSVDNLLKRLQGVAHKSIYNKKALDIMRRHSHTLKNRLKTINTMRQNSTKKVQSRLAKRSASKHQIKPTDNEHETIVDTPQKAREKNRKMYAGVRMEITRTISRKGDVNKYREEIERVKHFLRKKCDNFTGGFDNLISTCKIKTMCESDSTLSRKDFEVFVEFCMNDLDLNAHSGLVGCRNDDVMKAVWFSVILSDHGKDCTSIESFKTWLYKSRSKKLRN